MNSLSFWTSVDYGYPTLWQLAEDYLYLGGSRAYVLENEEVIISEKLPAPLYSSALKVISYSAIIMPLIGLALRSVARTIHQFHVVTASQKLEEGVASAEELDKVAALMDEVITGGILIEKIKVEEIKGSPLQFHFKELPNLSIKTFATAKTFLTESGNWFVIEPSSWLNEETESTFAYIVRTKEICLINRLSQVKLTPTKMMSLHGKKFMITRPDYA